MPNPDKQIEQQLIAANRAFNPEDLNDFNAVMHQIKQTGNSKEIIKILQEQEGRPNFKIAVLRFLKH